MVTFNGVKSNNRKKQHIVVKVFKDNLIKNYGITLDWLAIKRSNFQKRIKPTEINCRLSF